MYSRTLGPWENSHSVCDAIDEYLEKFIQAFPGST